MGGWEIALLVSGSVVMVATSLLMVAVGMDWASRYYAFRARRRALTRLRRHMRHDSMHRHPSWSDHA